MEHLFERHVWAEIDLDALRDNFKTTRRLAGDMPLCAVVKADAYGHGAVRCAQTFAEAGAAWLAVSRLTEALELRRAGQALPILILGRTDPCFAGVLAAHRITQCCYSLPYARALAAEAQSAGVTVDIHLKADTGMGRIGFALRTDFDAALREMVEACTLPGLRMTGLFQHFAAADEAGADSVAYTRAQHALFLRTFEGLRAAGHEPALVHCDNSAGTLLYPDWPAGLPADRRMGRPGIILYGCPPSGEVACPPLRPVMTLKTVVSMVKELAPGQSVSYGRRFTAAAPTRAATLCAGYADGYPRLLSEGRGVVDLHGHPCPVLGRVCMDQLLVDVSAVPQTAEGDEAILWGGGCQADTAATIAQKTGTIAYELLCGVARRVPRVYLAQGRTVGIDDYLSC